MGLIFHKPKKLEGWQERKEGTDTEKSLQGHPLEPHSSRFFQMPTAIITAPKEHTTLSGLVREMCRSSCQLGENHSSGSQPSGAAFSWTTTASAAGEESSPVLPVGVRPALVYLLVPTSRPPSPPRHSCPPFLPASPALFQWTFRPPKQEYFEIITLPPTSTTQRQGNQSGHPVTRRAILHLGL